MQFEFHSGQSLLSMISVFVLFILIGRVYIKTRRYGWVQHLYGQIQFRLWLDDQKCDYQYLTSKNIEHVHLQKIGQSYYYT